MKTKALTLGLICLLITMALAVLHQVAYWEGTANDSKNTETFTIGTHEWRIWWYTSPEEGEDESNFQIYVYKANGELAGVAANVIGKSNQFTTMRGKGNYYLGIITGQSYMITVYEDRK